MTSNANQELIQTVNTPCVGVCRVDGKYCSGCFRTIREIGAWSAASTAEKQAILDQVAERRLAAS